MVRVGRKIITVVHPHASEISMMPSEEDHGLWLEYVEYEWNMCVIQAAGRSFGIRGIRIPHVGSGDRVGHFIQANEGEPISSWHLHPPAHIERLAHDN